MLGGAAGDESSCIAAKMLATELNEKKRGNQCLKEIIVSATCAKGLSIPVAFLVGRTDLLFSRNHGRR
jgi:hypothetical protein